MYREAATLMRSKNVLPVQVVSSSDLMGGSQSVPKAAFEEALHNSIESSLRSAAVVPSSVFSSLFFSLRQSASSALVNEDVKPNTEQLNVEVSKHSSSTQEDRDGISSLHQRSKPLQHLASTVSCHPSSNSEGPPALLPASQVRHHSGIHEHTLKSSNGSGIPRSALPLLTQQQQLEQLQKFKQLQRLHAWQRIQKDQYSNSQPVSGTPSTASNLTPGPAQQLMVQGGPLPSVNSMRLPPTLSSTSAINGLHGNGTVHPVRHPIDNRTDHKPMLHNQQLIKGFCKAGKDIRLATFENDASSMAAYPLTYALLGLQTKPHSVDPNNLIVIALNLKSLPPPNTSAQALSAQCVGCGENALHTFGQLSDHVGLDATVDLTSPRLTNNSSQLVGTHARFYLVKDPKNPNRLIRGPPVLWNKAPDAQLQQGLATPQFGMMANLNPSSLHPRANALNFPSSVRLPTMSQKDAQMRATPRDHRLQSHPSGPYSNAPRRDLTEPLKRLSSTISTDPDLEAQDQLPPKRYLLSHDAASVSTVDVPQDLASSVQRKPVIVLMCPVGNLPRFVGDTSSITVTSYFAECFKEPSADMKEALKGSDHSLFTSGSLLLATLQYVVSLGINGNFCKEGLSQALLTARHSLSDAFLLSLKELRQNGLVALLNLIASTSEGRVSVVVSEFSVADATSRCLANIASKPTQMYQFAVQTSMSAKDVQFHLVVSSVAACRRLTESLLSPDDQTLILKQSLVSLQFTQLSLALAGPSNDNRLSSLSTSNHVPFVVSDNYSHTSHLNASACSRIASFQSETANALLDKINAHPNFDLSRFTSLRFIFLLPPSAAACAQTVDAIALSGIFSDLFKTSLPGSAFASQVVITMDESSRQRLLSTCKQWENTSTLLVFIQLDAHLISNRFGDCGPLNHKSIVDGDNVIVIQSTTSPYVLLTNQSRIPASNEVYACPYVSQTDADNRINSMYFSTSTTCNIPFSCAYDPQYEHAKKQLLNNNFMLHTSLITCELLIQQYTSSLLVAAVNDAGKQALRNRYRRFLSPAIDQVVQELLISSKEHQGMMVIVRAPSSILAAKFCDALTATRDKLNLQHVFEIVLYSDACTKIPVSRHFLDILKTSSWSNPDWKPTSLRDLSSVPCMVVYEGAEMVPQVLPRNLKYVDLRMAFEGIGNVHRTLLEQELSLAYPTCFPPVKRQPAASPRRKRMKPSSDSDDDAMQVVESSENSGPSDDGSVEETSNFTWSEQHNGSSSKEASSKRKLSRSPCESHFDFVSIAMKEADLASECKGGKKAEDEHVHCSPTLILPMNIHQLLEDEQEGRQAISALPPHPLCDWLEPLHPLPATDMSSAEISQFYRKWAKPLPKHPDCMNNDGAASGIEVDQRRFLLVTSPSAGAVDICCKFLRQLHSSLMKIHEVKVYSDPDDFEYVSCGSSFRTLLSNPWHKNQSQIENSCNDLNKLADLMNPDKSLVRRVETRMSSSTNASPVRQPSRTDAQEASQQSDISHSHHERHLLVLTSEDCKGELRVQLRIPKKHHQRFAYGCGPDGESQLRTLRLKSTSDPGIKTPVVSLAYHAVRDGLFDLRSTLSLSGADAANEDAVMHMIVVKRKDSESFQKYCPGSTIVVLPEDFDYLGRGSMKFAAQLIFTHFYQTETRRVHGSGASIWPFVMLVDDDCVSWSSWQPLDSSSVCRDSSASWNNHSLAEVLQNVEATIDDDFGVVGFRPWASVMKDPDTLAYAKYTENKETEQGNYMSERCVESCVMINLSKTCAVNYSRTRFYNEDIDWTLRAAASGVLLYRFENISLATKVVSPLADEALLKDRSKILMIAADSEFDPLPYHPNQLLECYFIRSAADIFPRSKHNSLHPVLCMDCYISLGVEIFVEYASSQVNAPSWSVDHSKEYGGLVLFCPDMDLDPDFLHGFRFSEGAAVSVIGNDRNSLRQSVLKLNLETNWHFRLTDEFQTANSDTLGNSRVRPLFLLTGLRKKTSHVAT